MTTIVGLDEDLKVTSRHESVDTFTLLWPSLNLYTTSVYPFIDPQVHYDSQTYAGKTVLITGASRGIGLETAKLYARAGAHLTIVARRQETLDASKDEILREQPSARVLTIPADVSDVKKAEEAVAATVAHFGRLDILVANAATIRATTARA
jgi:NADPH:quinone reductase-like Zn-dependent oxidoreductase